MSSNPYSRTYPYIYRGVVESNDDPKNLGRCKIRVPSIHGELNYSLSLLPWARPLVASPVSKNRGSVNIPDKGDIVWVFFEGANKKFPVYLGGTYSTQDININKNIVDIYKEKDFNLSYNRSTESCSIKVGDSQIIIDNNGISILGDLHLNGNLSVDGSLRVSGDTTLNNLQINGTCNLQCKCEV